VLSKKRILELYLNVAELGPDGQFGAEAGANYAFGRPASALSARSCLVASILPNPVTRSPKSGAWGAADGRDLCGPGPIGRNLRLLGAKSLILGHFNSFPVNSGLAFAAAFLYKRGLNPNLWRAPPGG
jgi:hypothetical protein